MPDKTLQWSEPVAFSGAVHKKLGPLSNADSAKRAFIVFLGILLLRYVSEIHPAPDAHPPDWPITFIIAVAVPAVPWNFFAVATREAAHRNCHRFEQGHQPQSARRNVIQISVLPLGSYWRLQLWVEYLSGRAVS